MKCRYLCLLFPLLMVACGQAPDGKPMDEMNHTANHISSGITSAGGVSVIDGMTVVRMTGDDRMKFNIESFSVPAGGPVQLILSNRGKMPRASMGHNVVFLTQDADPGAFVSAAASARDHDFIPTELSDQILAHSKLLGPGETDTIEFTAPEQSGEYVFLCSFPAHMYAGMRGLMIVE